MATDEDTLLDCSFQQDNSTKGKAMEVTQLSPAFSKQRPPYAARSSFPSSSSDSNESDEEVPWKRRARQKTSQQPMAVDQNAPNATPDSAFAKAVEKAKKQNRIWCTVMQEQGLTEDLQQFGVANVDDKIKVDRSCESYLVDPKHLDELRERDERMEREKAKHESGDKGRNAHPLRKRKRDAEAERVAWKIIKVLGEPKHDLVRNVVSILGKEKSLDLLHKTEDIEEVGGMMTLNGRRRRTPGGVFFQLLKTDPHITREQYNLIFEDERRQEEQKRKQMRRVKRQSKPRKVLRKLSKMNIDSQLSSTGMDMADDSSPNSANSGLVATNSPIYTATDDSNSGNNVFSVDAQSAVSAGKPESLLDDDELEEGEVID